MSDGELALVGRLTSPSGCKQFGLRFPLDPGEASCPAIAVSRGLVLATDDADALRALERHAAIEDARGLAAAAHAGAGDPGPPVDGARELFALGAERLSAAGDLVTAARGAQDEGKLAAERDRLASLLQSLSTQLDIDR